MVKSPWTLAFGVLPESVGKRLDFHVQYGLADWWISTKLAFVRTHESIDWLAGYMGSSRKKLVLCRSTPVQ